MSKWDFDNSGLYRTGIMVLALVLIALVVHNIYGENGFLASRKQDQQLKTYEQKIQQLTQENKDLEKENRALILNPAAIERAGRVNLGLVKPGEKVYKYAPKNPANPPVVATPESAPPR